MPDPTATQKNRTLSISTQLGPDKLLMRSISVTEHLNQLFQIELELDSTDGAIKFEDIVGTPATVSITLPNNSTRYFNGIVSRFSQDLQGTVPRYRATLSPWLWLLTRTSDCRIFQNMTIPAIVEQIFKDQGFNDYKLKLSATYTTLEFCVQYRESAFNFVSRLMEQAGICYFFQHTNGKHTLILTDSTSSHDTFTGYDSFNYQATGKPVAGNAEVVTEWIIEKELQSSTYLLNDFNFQTPKASLLVNNDATRSHQHADLKVYDYPGGYTTSDAGTPLAKIRIQELQSQYEILRGACTVRGVAVGSKFSLKNHPRSDQARSYLIIGMSSQETAQAYASGGSGGGGSFSCSFIAMPIATAAPLVQFRPPRVTPKPVIRGPQTAIVVGSSGNEIETDAYGRVRLHFHWDRYDQKDQNSSCFVRVAQVWAGKQWGSIFIPRINQEVIVEFLEGDPDRPIITGGVYNADQTVPVALPTNKTQSGIITRSTTGGSTTNFNQLLFEDKKGSEQISIQAEKDMLINIKNNSTETIVKNRSLTIQGTDTIEVDGDATETYKGNVSETVSKDVTQTYQGALGQTVSKDVTLTFQGALNQTVSKDVTDTFQGALSQTVSNDVTQTFQGGHTEKTTNTYSLSADTISITGQTKITLTVGGNSITIDSSGIKVNSAASLSLQGSGSTSVKGASISIG